MNKKWYGAKEIEMIWHGDWSDPELKFGENIANYYDVEQYCVDCMKEENLNYNDNEIFGEWVRNHEKEICDYITEIAAA